MSRRWEDLVGENGLALIGSYLRLIDFCITQLKAQGPSRTCHESKEEKEENLVGEDLLALIERAEQLVEGLQRESSLLTTYWSESTVSS